MAVDLRVMDLCFRQEFADSMPGMLSHHFGAFLSASELKQLARDVLGSIYRRLEHTASMDTQYRFADAFNNATSVVVDALVRSGSSGDSLAAVASWKQASAEATSRLYVQSRDAYFAKEAGAMDFLGATGVLYKFVRHDLGVKARRGDVKAGGHQGTWFAFTVPASPADLDFHNRSGGFGCLEDPPIHSCWQIVLCAQEHVLMSKSWLQREIPRTMSAEVAGQAQPRPRALGDEGVQMQIAVVLLQEESSHVMRLLLFLIRPSSI